MHYGQLAEYIRGFEQDLVEKFGVPRSAAVEIAHSAELDAINAECVARKENQFLLDFDRMGSKELAKKRGISDRAVRERRTQILRRKVGSGFGTEAVDAASA